MSPNAYYNLLNFYTIYYNEYSESGLHSFTLSKYGKYHEFFSESKADILKWMDHLRYLCITSNFSEHFELGPKIGKGHFAKVLSDLCSFLQDSINFKSGLPSQTEKDLWTLCCENLH